MRMLNTFLRELITQSNTAFSLGTLLIVFRGLRTRNTRSDFITPRFSPAELPLKRNILCSFIFSLGIDKMSEGISYIDPMKFAYSRLNMDVC